MSRSVALIPITFALLLAGGCMPKTEFRGNPHIEGGPGQCQAICSQWGMELAGMVAMGEYSSGCICKRPGAAAAGDSEFYAAAGSGAAAGVRMQMDDQEAAEAEQRRQEEERKKEEEEERRKKQLEENKHDPPASSPGGTGY